MISNAKDWYGTNSTKGAMDFNELFGRVLDPELSFEDLMWCGSRNMEGVPDDFARRRR